MLTSIPAWKLEEWRIFEELDPDAQYRADFNAAHIVQALMRDGKQLREFLLPFGDSQVEKKVPQTIAYQERLIDAWCFISNALQGKQRA